MNQRVVTGLLTAGCIALAGAGYMTYKNQDRTAPEIKVNQSKKMAYTEGEDYGKLLEGVTAQDDKDGDLTSEVFVEKVVPVSKKKAVVYYGVTDKANNVGTASREVTYQVAEGSDAAEDTASEDIAEDTTQKTDEKSAKKTKKKSQKAKTKKTAEDKKTEETTQDAAAEQQSADQQSEVLQPNGTRPAMKLAEEAKVIAKGTSFNALNEVTDAVDDKDDRDTLFRGLHIDGNYNVNQAGTYTLQYYVQDSDGNTSDPITFTLTVQ